MKSWLESFDISTVCPVFFDEKLSADAPVFRKLLEDMRPIELHNCVYEKSEVAFVSAEFSKMNRLKLDDTAKVLVLCVTEEAYNKIPRDQLLPLLHAAKVVCASSLELEEKLKDFHRNVISIPKNRTELERCLNIALLAEYLDEKSDDTIIELTGIDLVILNEGSAEAAYQTLNSLDGFSFSSISVCTGILLSDVPDSVKVLMPQKDFFEIYSLLSDYIASSSANGVLVIRAGTGLLPAAGAILKSLEQSKSVFSLFTRFVTGTQCKDTVHPVALSTIEALQEPLPLVTYVSKDLLEKTKLQSQFAALCIFELLASLLEAYPECYRAGQDLGFITDDDLAPPNPLVAYNEFTIAQRPELKDELRESGSEWQSLLETLYREVMTKHERFFIDYAQAALPTMVGFEQRLTDVQRKVGKLTLVGTVLEANYMRAKEKRLAAERQVSQLMEKINQS